jgi:hypothetical protein
VRRAAPRLTVIAGLAALLWFWDGGVWELLPWLLFVVAVLGCLSPAWADYVLSGVDRPGWLASEPAGEWNVVLDAPGPRPIQIIKVLRDATGGPLAAAKDAVDGAPSTVARGLCVPAADQLVAALIAAGASAHRQPGR